MSGSDLLRLVNRPVETITVPEWGEVHVRGLSVLEYDRFEVESAKSEARQAITGWILRYGVVDAKGVHLFNDSQVAELNNLPAGIGTPLARAIYRLSLATADAEKKSPATAD